MKQFKSLIALVVAAILVVSLAVAANAATITINSTANSGTAQTDTTEYTYWKIFSADIETAPSGTAPIQTGGSVAYFVTTEAQKTAIESTNLFNVTRVGTTNKWYVELKNSATTAEQIAAAFKTMDKAAFTVTNTFAQTTPGGSASVTGLDEGYYYITSTAGTNVVLQTLADVTITEKNTYPPHNKEILPADVHAQIGQTITYTLTVDVPYTANDQIVLTDTMSAGLTFLQIKSDSLSGTQSGTTSGTKGAVFTITYSPEQIKGLVSGTTTGSKKITVVVEAYINEDAQVDTGIPNTLDLKYGNHYTAKPKTVETQTTHFDFDKVDGASGTIKLTGAEFQLKQGGNVVPLVQEVAGELYHIATPAELATSGTTTTTIVTNGNTVRIKGLDSDVEYSLEETKAPTGYNKLDHEIAVKASGTVFVHQNIENNKGSVLPSTGGIGTTIFYVIGAVLVLGAAAIMIARRKAEQE